MRRLLALPAALAALALAPAAASAVTVGDPGDDAVGDPTACVTSVNCKLRDAVAFVSTGGGSIGFTPGLAAIGLADTLQIPSSNINITDAEGDVTVRPTSGTVEPLIEFTAGTAGGALVQGVNFTDPGGTAIRVDPSVAGVKIERSPIFNVTTPISLGSGANGGIQPPQNLRVGPRQPNGSLPVRGTVASGSRVDVYTGDPSGATATKFLGMATPSAGAFSLVPATQLTPGTRVAATVTGTGTSQYSATATVPADITSPTLNGAVAFSTNEVIVVPSEPLDGRSLNLSDFSLQMAGVPRAIAQGAVAPDGSRVYLISSQPWNPGEAGSVSLAGAGVVTDTSGNFNLGPSPVLVGAAPGDFQPPVVQSLKIRPTKACLTKGPKCKHVGVTISFITNEVGKAVVVVNRASNRRAGEFVKRVKTAGAVKITWRGTIHGRKLRAGRYVVEVSMEDNVGNVTDSPPFQVIHIVRTR